MKRSRMNRRSSISQIKAFLDEEDISVVWRRLLITLVEQDYPTLYSTLVSSPEFSEVKSLDDNLLGSLSIGEIGILYEYSLAYTNRDERKDNGQYFTPDDVAQFLASQCDKINSHSKAGGVWLDPCCGVGNLSYWLIERQDDPADFLKNRMLFMDLDPLALLIARTLMCCFFGNADPELFANIRDKFICQNYLTEPVTTDYIIANPPYSKTALNNIFETAKVRDLYAYFMEKISKESRGSVTITPQSFLNAQKFTPLRKVLMTYSDSIDLYVFDNVPDSIFRGIKYGSTNSNTSNSVRACVTVREGQKNASLPVIRSTPLVRWRAAERGRMFEKIETLKSESEPSGTGMFYKNYPQFGKLLQEGLESIRLKDLTSKKSTSISLNVPTTPRYYITASVRNLSRSSMRTLYFDNKRNQQLAYILINSSYAYWWWRIADGGMTLSSATLSSLPVPTSLLNLDDEILAELAKKLNNSEKDNLTIKRNAGKDNENVKHGKELILLLNQSFLPDSVAKELLTIQSNSDISSSVSQLKGL